MNKILIVLVVSMPLVAALGCSSDGPSAAEQKQLKVQFERKNFDIKDVPPERREMVQGFIDRQKQMLAAGKQPGVGK